MREANVCIRIWQIPWRKAVQVTLGDQRRALKPTLGKKVDMKVHFLKEMMLRLDLKGK